MNPADLVRLMRASGSILGGRDYFHRTQPLGRHWNDPRCYYNDLRAKADWDGRTLQGVPLLHVPRLGGDVEFPIMILQFGLGSMDRIFLQGEDERIPAVAAVLSWIERALHDRDNFDNVFPRLDPTRNYASSNSGMAQGEALSFLTRVAEHLPEIGRDRDLASLMLRIRNDMLRPVKEGGTVRELAQGTAFCETCRGEGHVVYNGWIFALFGLLDHATWAHDSISEQMFSRSEQALAASLDQLVLQDGWSVYDQEGVLASPFYQRLHIDLIDAMGRLTGRDAYGRARGRLLAGWKPRVRWVRTAQKGLMKLRQTSMHTGGS